MHGEKLGPYDLRAIEIVLALHQQRLAAQGQRGATEDDLIGKWASMLIAEVRQLRAHITALHTALGLAPDAGTDEALAAVRALVERGRADERAAVVAWLRYAGAHNVEYFSRSIERGEHIKP